MSPGGLSAAGTHGTPGSELGVAVNVVVIVLVVVLILILLGRL
jgi:hypothetical protein